MANLKLLIESIDSDALVQALIDSQKPAPNANMPDFVLDYVKNLLNGRNPGSVLRFSACDVQPSATAQCTSVVADDTITIGAKVLTAKASVSTQDQFLVGGSDSATATNLATCINANTDLLNWLKASASSDTVTLTCLVAGKLGNNVPLAADSTITLSGAFLASGTDVNNKKVTL